MNDQRLFLEPVAHECVNLGSFRHANEGARDLQRTSFKRERQHVDARILITVRMPFALSCLQPNCQRCSLQRACGRAVVIDSDRLECGRMIPSREDWSRMRERNDAGCDKHQTDVSRIHKSPESPIEARDATTRSSCPTYLATPPEAEGIESIRLKRGPRPPVVVRSIGTSRADGYPCSRSVRHRRDDGPKAGEA